MYMLSIGIALLSLQQGLQAQDTIVDSTVYLNRYNDRFKTFVGEAGVTHPIGKLKQHMNRAPSVGLWIREQHAPDVTFNYGVSFNFPEQRYFNYKKATLMAKTKSFAGMLGFRVDQVFPWSKQQHVDFEVSAAVGYAFFFYDDLRAREEYAAWPEARKQEEEEPEFVKPLSSLYLGQGITLRIRDFGVFGRYNFTPYSFFTHTVDRSFGMHSVTVGLFFRQYYR